MYTKHIVYYTCLYYIMCVYSIAAQNYISYNAIISIMLYVHDMQ